MMRGLALALLFAAGLSSCAAAEKAAAQDPMKCERDPKCEKKRGKVVDCARQCTDDPACMERCEQVQQSDGRLGR